MYIFTDPDLKIFCSFNYFSLHSQGQIAVNRRANTRSYASLRDLVNGVFPPVSSFEQVKIL